MSVLKTSCACQVQLDLCQVGRCCKVSSRRHVAKLFQRIRYKLDPFAEVRLSIGDGLGPGPGPNGRFYGPRPIRATCYSWMAGENAQHCCIHHYIRDQAEVAVPMGLGAFGQHVTHGWAEDFQHHYPSSCNMLIFHTTTSVNEGKQ